MRNPTYKSTQCDKINTSASHQIFRTTSGCNATNIHQLCKGIWVYRLCIHSGEINPTNLTILWQICDKSFSQKFGLLYHNRTVHVDGDSPHKCTLCSELLRNGSKRGITTAQSFDMLLTRRDLHVGCMCQEYSIIVAEFFTMGTSIRHNLLIVQAGALFPHKGEGVLWTGSCFTGISQLLRSLKVGYYSFCTMQALICVHAAQGTRKHWMQ